MLVLSLQALENKRYPAHNRFMETVRMEKSWSERTIQNARITLRLPCHNFDKAVYFTSFHNVRATVYFTFLQYVSTTVYFILLHNVGAWSRRVEQRSAVEPLNRSAVEP